MRSLFVKGICLCLLMSCLGINNVIAQKAKKPAAKKTTTSNANPFGGAATGNANPFGGNTGGTKQKNAKPSTNANPFETSNTADPFSSSNAAKGNKADTSKRPGGSKDVPIEIVKSSGSGNPLTDSNKISLRNDNIVEANSVKDRTPLTYDFIREDDAVFKQRIWRIIDAREKMNLCFKNPIEGDSGSELFFVMLYKAVMDGGVTAFEDERFTTPFTKQKFKESFSGGVDTSNVLGLDGETVLRKEVRNREFPIDSVFRFQLKEEIVFDKEASRLVTRILGIAPMGPQILPNGKILEGPAITYFWIYYPDIRSVFSKYDVYNPKNFGNRMSWEDLFESRMFSSYITKSTIDNPFNQSLVEKHGKNKLFMLLEGEAIKEKIFNYEQDLWAY